MKIRDMLYALWTKVSDDTGWLTLEQGIKYRRKASVVYVGFDSLQVTVQTAEQVVGTLPTGFRPTTYTQPYLRSQTGLGVVCWISPDGKINITELKSGQTILAGFVVFPVG